jgi:dolichol-phosphate mannosyltransferase
MKAPFPISIVIPVFNEHDNLLPLIGEIQQALPAQHPMKLSSSMMAVPTGTRELLREQAKIQNGLRGVYHQGNYGQSAALLSARRQAQYPWIVTMDGDGQNDPKDIMLLLETLRSRATRSTPRCWAIVNNAMTVGSSVCLRASAMACATPCWAISVRIPAAA